MPPPTFYGGKESQMPSKLALGYQNNVFIILYVFVGVYCFHIVHLSIR